MNSNQKKLIKAIEANDIEEVEDIIDFLDLPLDYVLLEEYG